MDTTRRALYAPCGTGWVFLVVELCFTVVVIEVGLAFVGLFASVGKFVFEVAIRVLAGPIFKTLSEVLG